MTTEVLFDAEDGNGTVRLVHAPEYTLATSKTVARVEEKGEGDSSYLLHDECRVNE